MIRIMGHTQFRFGVLILAIFLLVLSLAYLGITLKLNSFDQTVLEIIRFGKDLWTEIK